MYVLYDTRAIHPLDRYDYYRAEQAGNQVDFRARDIALYDLSRPGQATHSTGPGLMLFGVSATQVRRLATQRLTGREG